MVTAKMPTLAIPVRASFIIDFPLDNERGGPATPMSATIERKPTNLAPTASADSITCGFSSFFTSFAGSNFVDEKISTMSMKQDGGKIIPRKTTNDLIRTLSFMRAEQKQRRTMFFSLIIRATEWWPGRLIGLLLPKLTRCRLISPH
jgi:hypothetical protein